MLLTEWVRLRTQIVLLQVALVALTLGGAFVVFAQVNKQRLSTEYEQRALAIARAVAVDAQLRAEVADYSARTVRLQRSELQTGPVQRIAEEVRVRTGAMYVVVTDDAGLRLAHPDHDRLAAKVSTDPAGALGGADVVEHLHGSLGERVGAKVPVRAPDGRRVVGEVSVGISTAAVHEQWVRDLRRAAPLGGLALLLGVTGAVLLARWWHGLMLTQARQLAAVRSMSSGLRAQRHEYANRLHLLHGLLHGGHPQEAAQYLNELLGSGPLGAELPGVDAVHDPHLQAFLTVKAAHARESGVLLRLGPNTWVESEITVPVDVTTVLGNLIDNAVEALRTSTAELRQVEVELVQEDTTLHITVGDSGPGIPADMVDSIFSEGFSTNPDNGAPGGRGIGLALARRVARTGGGDLVLSSPGNSRLPLSGAEFIARLPGTLAKGEQK